MDDKFTGEVVGAEISTMRIEIAALRQRLAAAEAEREALAAALRAQELAELTSAEYYKQCDLGEAPSTGWERIDYSNVAWAFRTAKRLRQAALARREAED